MEKSSGEPAESFFRASIRPFHPRQQQQCPSAPLPAEPPSPPLPSPPLQAASSHHSFLTSISSFAQYNQFYLVPSSSFPSFFPPNHCLLLLRSPSFLHVHRLKSFDRSPAVVLHFLRLCRLIDMRLSRPGELPFSDSSTSKHYCSKKCTLKYRKRRIINQKWQFPWTNVAKMANDPLGKGKKAAKSD